MEIKRTDRDVHVLYPTIGEKLGRIPESTVRRVFISIWCQCYSEEVTKIINQIDSLLPHEIAVQST